jgi:hypothetical protein
MPENRADPIPESFATPEEAGEFWDRHDTMDYPDGFTDVGTVSTDLRHRYFEVEVEMSVAEALRTRAQEQGVSVRELATELLRRQLTAA